ncbi:serine protease inhibitor 8 precursor [Bombyx mori]|uniref:Serpin-8 n=1 Tax=Bombyx mori TaxID=7091 RepID=C0J8F9_BOMMO|nr:serine protease inhibitor 8 precursor [Bombyx mori]ACG61173.1 serpin-8 [Bombyx mori]
MKLLHVSLLVASFAAFKPQASEAQSLIGNLVQGSHVFGNLIPPNICNEDQSQKFKGALAEFSSRLYRVAGQSSNFHFVVAPLSIWLSLAALGEGGDPKSQKELFEVLNLPAEACKRERYYQIANSLATPGTDVHLTTTRALILDNNLIINPDWSKFVHTAKLLHIVRAPIKKHLTDHENPIEKREITQDEESFGNSFLIDTLDYSGLWTTAFPEATIERETFHNDEGVPLGTVDMMRAKRRARLGHIPIANAKVLELPVGHDGRYTILIAMGLNNTSVNQLMGLYRRSVVIDIFNSLTVSLIPIDIAIPKFHVTSEYNAKRLLEDIGIKSLWYDPDATRYVSNPAALPGGFLQRVTVKIDSAGLNPAQTATNPNILNGILSTATNVATGLAAAVGRDFIANKPFMYSLVDTKTETVLFEGAYSLPDPQSKL